MTKKLRVADLFCGAGGSSTGIAQFCEAVGLRLDLVAVNHWERAVETHAANHPTANHFCQDLTRLKPGEAVPGGKLDLLVASPECTHHSNARGGKPKNDQSRASAWVVLEWVNALAVDRVLIENVPEFVSWGPLGTDGKPLKSRKGETFQAFVKALEGSGYRVAWKLLNAADYGAATSRRRLFIQAVKGRRPLVWPNPSHERNPARGLFGRLPRWRAAREVIDWNLTGESIFGRKRPLSANTLRRIEAGLRKFGGANAEPFLVALRHMGNAEGDGRGCRSLDSPTPTVTASGGNIGLVEPFTVKVTNQGDDNCRVKSLTDPLGTLTASNGYGVCEPFVLPPEGVHRGNAPRDPGDPLQTVTAGRGGGHLVQPFLIPTFNGERPGQTPRTHSVDSPVPTVVACRPTHAVVEPFILPHRKFQQMDVDSVDGPVRTIDATNGGCNALCEPFVVPFYGSGVPDRVGDPLATVTAKDRFELVQPDGSRIDIRFRMLQPHELAAAMGFPAEYKITGNRADQVRQIGNAVEVNQSRALAAAMVGGPQR